MRKIEQQRNGTNGVGLSTSARRVNVLAVMLLIAGLMSAAAGARADESVSIRLPETAQPTIGAWFCGDDFLEPGGYRAYVDLYADHSPYDLLAMSFRVNQREVTESSVHDLVKEAVTYARQRGLRVALDLDVRLARLAFQQRYPGEQQEMLRLRTTPLGGSGEIEFAIASETLGDHMTGNTTPYIPLSGRLVRVYTYVPEGDQAAAGSIHDITARCAAKTASEKEVRVTIPCDASTQGRTACVMAAFTHFTPDVYAPHLLEFQRTVVAQYADVALSGLMKDEWGFPPCHGGCPEKNDFWYSEARAQAYAEASGGRDLVRDCLLMHLGEQGQERERLAAINLLLKTSRERNAAIEDQYYRLAKEFFGKEAAVVTHATWVSYPGPSEYKKNGLDWWAATRDWGQTDEYTPFPARTALAKKWGSVVWYNQFYSTHIADYEQSLWTHALGGGRINYHPIYPNPEKKPRRQCNAELLEGGLMRGECRMRLLPLITQTPIDCPVAVVFGHACAMNWAGPAYKEVGMEVTDAFWQSGYYADLIPASEIASGALAVAADGTAVYGPQRYAAVVLYHPEFETPDTAAYFQKIDTGKTALFCIGEWTRDFQANDFDGTAALPVAMERCEDGAAAAAAKAIETLQARGVVPCSPATQRMEQNGSVCPAREGHIRLIDGTEVWLAGTVDVAGDPVSGAFQIGGHAIAAEATGILAVRLTPEGGVDALVAGGLRRFECGGFTVRLDAPADVAFWHDAQGNPHGMLQDWAGPVPEALRALTPDWRRLCVPAPYSGD